MSKCTCYQLQVFQHADFAGPWTGWKLRGRYLVTPDGVRVPVTALVGLVLRWQHLCGMAKRSPHAGGNVLCFVTENQSAKSRKLVRSSTAAPRIKCADRSTR